MFAAAVGLGTALLAGRFGKPAAVGLLFVLFGLAVRGLMAQAARRRG